MIPRIIDKSVNIEEVDYVDLSGYGTLPDILEGSYSKEELHTGVLTLSFDYPCDGINANMLVGDNYVLYKINSYEDPHLFIINQIEKDTDDLVYSVFCDSVTYLADLDVNSYFQLNKGATTNDFINKLNNVGDFKKIILSTDITGSLPNGFLSKTLRNKVDLINSESKDSFIRGFGGYIKRYKNNIQILTRRGTNRPEVLTYGDDLLEVSCEYDYSGMVTAVKYICDEDSDGFVVESPIIYADNNTTNSLKHLKVISISKYELQREFGYIPEIPLLTMLTNKANSYFNSADNIGISEPDVSLKVKIDEKKTIYGRLFNNYKDFEFKIGDRVELRVDKLGINITSEISSINYDGVLEEIKELTFGKVKRYINTPYKEEFEAPSNSNNTNNEIPSEYVIPVDPVVEIPPIIATNPDGKTRLAITPLSLTVLNGTNVTSPTMTVTVTNPINESVYIYENGGGSILGDLYGPKLSNNHDDGLIHDQSKKKYFAYSNGIITIKYAEFRQDVISAGIDPSNPDYIFQPGQSFTLYLRTDTPDSYYDARKTVTITIEGVLTDDTYILPASPTLIDYMQYLYEKDEKFFSWIYPRLVAYNTYLNAKLNIKAVFTDSKLVDVNHLANDDLFAKLLTYLVEYKEKYNPNTVIRDMTEQEYADARSAFLMNKEVLMTEV